MNDVRLCEDNKADKKNMLRLIYQVALILEELRFGVRLGGLRFSLLSSRRSFGGLLLVWFGYWFGFRFGFGFFVVPNLPLGSFPHCRKKIERETDSNSSVERERE